MKAQGFELDWPTPTPMEVDLSAGMGHLSPTDAEQGYEIFFKGEDVERSTADAVQQRTDAALQAGGEAMGLALFGDGQTVEVKLPDGSSGTTVSNGCLADARRRLWGDDLETWARGDMVSKNFLPQIVGRAVQSKAMTATIDAWRRCMAQAGFKVESVQDALASHGTPEERATALADAGCRQTTRLPEVYDSEFNQVAASVIEESGAVLQEYVLAVQKTAKQAASVG